MSLKLPGIRISTPSGNYDFPSLLQEIFPQENEATSAIIEIYFQKNIFFENKLEVTNSNFVINKSISIAIKDHPAIHNIRNIVEEIYSNFSNVKYEFPFIFLEGSSGMGKSQSLLASATLYGEGQEFEKKTFFLVADPSSTQSIYSPFKEQSIVFKKCVANDVDILQMLSIPKDSELLEDVLNIDSIQKELLYTWFHKSASFRHKRWDDREDILS